MTVPDTGRTAEEMETEIGFAFARYLSAKDMDASPYGLVRAAVEPILQDLIAARKERDEARTEADGLRKMIRALAEMQKSAREAEERHAQWQWDHPIVRGTTTTAAEAEAAQLRSRLLEAEMGGEIDLDQAMKRGIRAWSARLHIPVTRMMSRALREEIRAALNPNQEAGDGNDR